MKNQTKFNKSKLVARGMLIMAVLFFVSMLGCDMLFQNQGNDDNTIRVGYESYPTMGGAPGNPFWVACKSDTNKFDINDVTLTFSYGFPSGNAGTSSYPVYEIWFDNDEKQEKLIKRVEENLNSEEYLVILSFDNDQNVQKNIYNHSEILTIPSELFSKDSGYVGFYISSIDITAPKNGPLLNYITFYYEKIEDEIVLTIAYPLI